jgi:hypothetical protein
MFIIGMGRSLRPDPLCLKSVVKAGEVVAIEGEISFGW